MCVTGGLEAPYDADDSPDVWQLLVAQASLHDALIHVYAHMYKHTYVLLHTASIKLRGVCVTEWKPCMDLKTVLMSLSLLVTQPTPHDALYTPMYTHTCIIAYIQLMLH